MPAFPLKQHLTVKIEWIYTLPNQLPISQKKDLIFSLEWEESWQFSSTASAIIPLHVLTPLKKKTKNKYLK